MPAVLKRAAADRLERAGDLARDPRTEAAPKPDDAQLRALGDKIASMASKLSALDGEQRAEVLRVAKTAAQQSDAILAVLTELTRDKPRVLERWDVEVTRRDRNGRAELYTLTQKV